MGWYVNMATYTGSGKYIAIQNGQVKCGVDNQQYGYFQAVTKNYKAPDGITNIPFYGINSNIQSIDLQNVNELVVGTGLGYTGNLRLYSYYYSPYNTLIWDKDDMDISRIRSTEVVYKFVNGIMVGTA